MTDKTLGQIAHEAMLPTTRVTMDFQAFWAELWARCGPAHMGFEQCEAARDVYEKAKAKIEAAERERCTKEVAAECAQICAGFVDAKEQTRASLAAAKAIKKGSQRDMIDRLSHEGTVSLHNSVLQRCEAAIKARFGLDAQGPKE
jgi:hypothetical protein